MARLVSSAIFMPRQHVAAITSSMIKRPQSSFITTRATSTITYGTNTAVAPPFLHDNNKSPHQLTRPEYNVRSFSSITPRKKKNGFRRRARPPPPQEDLSPMFKQKKGPIKNAYAQLGGLDSPYDMSEDYLELTSLSPWVPVPDPVARKMFDLAEPKPEDIHVDLGSGDGRVNFHAIDNGVQKSIGIDIDEGIVKVATKRLMKRHPQPDIEFIVADLLDERHEAWTKVQEASIITMFFVTDALKQVRPILERKLSGRTCKIITCGYQIPGWTPSHQETILSTTVYLYKWNFEPSSENNSDEMMMYDEELMSMTQEESENKIKRQSSLINRVTKDKQITELPKDYIPAAWEHIRLRDDEIYDPATDYDDDYYEWTEEEKEYGIKYHAELEAAIEENSEVEDADPTVQEKKEKKKKKKKKKKEKSMSVLVDEYSKKEDDK